MFLEVSIIIEIQYERSNETNENSVKDSEGSARKYGSSASEMPSQSTPTRRSPVRSSKRSNDQCNPLLETIGYSFKKPKPKNDYRHELFGKNVALKMGDISNNTQRLLVEKIINDALFMAEMGQLTMSHSICVSTDNTNSPTGVSTYQHINNTYSQISQTQTKSYSEPLSPVTMNSENSNQSFASYNSKCSDS